MARLDLLPCVVNFCSEVFGHLDFIMLCAFLRILQEKRIAKEIADLEKDTGFKLRVLAQNYPVTPGMIYGLKTAYLIYLMTFLCV